MITDLRIAPLHACSHLMVETAALMQTVWPAYYGPDGQGDALADLGERSRTEGLPFGMVAALADGAVAGTAALSPTSFGATAPEKSWLTGLCVRPDLRGHGIASLLVLAMEAHAAGQYPHLYATTREAGGLLRRLGWQELREVPDVGGSWQVLRKAVATKSPA